MVLKYALNIPSRQKRTVLGLSGKEKKMSDSPFLENRNRIIEDEVGFVILDGFSVSEGHC